MTEKYVPKVNMGLVDFSMYFKIFEIHKRHFRFVTFHLEFTCQFCHQYISSQMVHDNFDVRQNHEANDVDKVLCGNFNVKIFE